mmetsp:Transcript_36319/g.78319  ORF Transcript_36319/g.78319 Transcript_36319/m.78319 type:complete len:197 (+) Transcript_36319:176-766(+)
MATMNKTTIFRGDNEELLDNLIYACHEHKANKPLEGFGRELEPFFKPGEELGPLPTATNKQNSNRKQPPCGSPTSSAGSRSAKSKGNKQSRKQSAGGSFDLMMPDQSIKTSQPVAAPKRTASAKRSTSPKSHGSLSSSPGSSIAACPAFFSSPKPDAVPMPTFAFLNKAATIAGGPRCMDAGLQQVPRMAVPSAAA